MWGVGCMSWPRRRKTPEQEVQEAVERILALGDVEPHAAYGEPAEELALPGASVDLLIVGSRNYGPPGTHDPRQHVAAAGGPGSVPAAHPAARGRRSP